MRKQLKLNTIFLTSVGTIIEFYDFFIFIMLAPVIANNFFVGSEYIKLMGAYAVLGIGSLIRPLSGLFFAHFGDRIGRKKIFLVSIALMSTGTFMIAFIPTYYSIGIMATIILILVRLLQGISLGGETPGAFTFVYEHMESKKRIFGIALLCSGITIGIFMASFVMFILNKIYTGVEIDQFYWRIPFIIGGILGLTGFIMRFSLLETPEFLNIKKNKAIEELPSRRLFAKFKLRSLIGFSLILVIGILCIFFEAYLPAYLHVELKYSYSQATNLTLLFNSCAIIFFILISVTSLKIDMMKWNRYFPALFIATIIITIITMKSLIIRSSFIELGIILSALFIIIVYIIATVKALSLFPTEIRYTGSAVTYNIGFAMAEAVTPILFTWLLHFTKYQFSVLYLAALLGLTGLIMIFLIPLAELKY